MHQLQAVMHRVCQRPQVRAEGSVKMLSVMPDAVVFIDNTWVVSISAKEHVEQLCHGGTTTDSLYTHQHV